MSDDVGIRLPKANLITAINGGEDALKDMVEANSSDRFHGYVKVTMKVSGTPANGVVVLVRGRPEMAYYSHQDEKLFGQLALPRILDITKSRKCVLKLYSFPADSHNDISNMVVKLTNCRINLTAFWESTGDGKGEAGPRKTVGGGVGVPAKDGVMEGATEAFKAIVGEGIVVVEDGHVEEEKGEPIDDGKISKVEEALKGREERIRQEIERKLVEREELKKEEEKYLKMDEVFSKLLKEREEELKKKETQLSDLETSVKKDLETKEKRLENKEEEINKQMDDLQREREDMKQREQKLLEMEKMFRRVLANTEDRLKKKEEELINKEEELKMEVAERMKLIEDLKLREARVKEIEQQLQAHEHGDELVTEEIKKRDDRIRSMEGELKEAKEEMDKLLRQMEEERAVHEDIKTCLGILDGLLGKLPEEEIERFSTSEGFEIYERIMRHFKLTE